MIKYLSEQGELVIGLLTAKAMKGYKKEIVPYKDRKEILDFFPFDFQIIPQNSLNPSHNLKKTKCTHIASGDGWEQVELDAINKLKVIPMNVLLPGEIRKKYSSSSILNT